ncbi:hypothetical protein Tco_0053795 [Tanacetum coccineum]
MEMVLYQSPQIHKDKSRFCLQELQKKFVTKKNWTSSHQKKKIMLCMARTSREHTQDSEDEYVSIPTKEQETPSFANQQVKTPRETVKNHFTHSKNPKVDKKELGYGFTARAFNTARASGTKNVSTARHSFNRQAVLTSAALKVNTVKPIVNRLVLLGEKGKLLLSPQRVVFGDHKDTTGTMIIHTELEEQRELLIMDVPKSTSHDWKQGLPC